MGTMLSSPFTAVINHLLAREPWATEKLARHAGKIARLDAGVVAVNVKVAADGMLQPADEEAANGTSVINVINVTIRARLADLPLIAQNRERAFSYVQIEGDADFANTISQLSQSLRWEAEADLSRWIGDIAAMRVVGGARTLVDTAKATHRKLTENIAEYFLEENPLLIRPSVVTEFASEVARLRDDVERLEKRISKLTGSR